MSLDRFVARQLAIRLKRVRRQIAALSAEAEMIERMIADAEHSAVVPRLKLRKNSQGKWTVRSQIRAYLEERTGPVRAKTLYDFLKQYDPSLKASTFRSHLRRMVDDNVVKREGSRGYYQLVNRPTEEPKEVELFRPRAVRMMIRTRHL